MRDAFPHLDDAHRLSGQEPAELLAAASLGLARGIEHSLVVLAETPDCDAWSISAMDLEDLLRPDGRERLEDLLSLLADLDPSSATALLVLEDGYRGPGADDCVEIADLLAPWVIAGALQLLPRAVPLDQVWTLACGSAVLTVLRGADHHGMDLAVTDPLPLGALEETAVAADAVLRGIPWPRHRLHEQDALAEVLESCDTEEPAVETAATCETMSASQILRNAITVIEALHARTARVSRTRTDGSGPTANVTECEPLLRLLRTLDDDAGAAGVLAAMTGVPARPQDGIDTLIEALQNDGRRAPGRDVVPGGRVFDRMEDLYVALGIAGWADGGEDRRRSWLHLGTLLAALSWWARRERAAGAILDELLLVEPGWPLARLLAATIDDGGTPAWAIADHGAITRSEASGP